ncbi:Transducin/WD40 repeat-like superfamily protein [Striga hermonthica]|uniref:tRNA (guanine-N(7)-)-methyltransferase non-catalytic subunit n=1 Tax=Striga hermonthica TaxID=68872 RepID=A0A9N7RHG8_STRHE|nr:Transducin/WD40 repeat-like superfamily protein [Striga hermonthica]
MEDVEMEESKQKLEMEVAPALIAVHPNQNSVSVSVGSDVRVFSLQDGSRVKLIDDNGVHKDSIRAIRYSKSGKLFVSAGDDKLVKIWDTNCWRCFCSVVSEKRVTSAAISNDEMFVCFADKFGVVYVVDIRNYDYENPAVMNKKAVPILSHYCSIITRLEFSPDGKYIVTADRDFKIRVTVFPKEPLHGAHDIQSFCLGHTEFVSCITFVSNKDYTQGFLVSGSGDSTVRLWDYTSGSLLDMCDVGTKVVELDLNQKSKFFKMIGIFLKKLYSSIPLKSNLISTSLCRNFLTKNLLKIVIDVKDEAFIPTCIGAPSSASILWMVMGASTSQSKDSTPVARVRAISDFGTKNGPLIVLGDHEIPGSEPLLQELQGKMLIGEEAFSTAAEAVKTAMRNLLIKKQYSTERRELKKKGRNDKKNKMRA